MEANGKFALGLSTSASCQLGEVGIFDGRLIEAHLWSPTSPAFRGR
jgi:hypothetical protein